VKGGEYVRQKSTIATQCVPALCVANYVPYVFQAVPVLNNVQRVFSESLKAVLTCSSLGSRLALLPLGFILDDWLIAPALRLHLLFLLLLQHRIFSSIGILNSDYFFFYQLTIKGLVATEL
jgi:hypothetical protein